MIDIVENPGTEKFSPAKSIGAAMADYMSKHDDFLSFFLPMKPLAINSMLSMKYLAAPGIYLVLILTCRSHLMAALSKCFQKIHFFACMAGHLSAGGHAAMTSYESFFMIIASQLLQHLKFLQQSKKVTWRPEYPAANLLSTSTCWRQDHNGFTHQSPALISTLLSLPSNLSNCLFSYR